MQSDIDEFTAAGCNEYLSKPVKREQLTQLCKKYLRVAKEEEGEANPIHSSLLQEEPGLQDIVIGFVAKYPELINTMRGMLQDEDMDGFQQMAHELKGSGGNVGYMEITNICSQIEFQLGAGNLEEVGHLLDKLARLHPRIQAGLPQGD